MTRPSAWELEQVLNDLEPAPRLGTNEDVRLGDHYPEDVVDVIHDVARSLFKLLYESTELEDLQGSERVMRFLALVRERYEIDEDDDAAVLAALESRPTNSPHLTPAMLFAVLPISTAAEVAIRSGWDRRVTESARSGRGEQAAEFLIRTGYRFLAEKGGSGGIDN